jgi:hypothetical protein
MVSGALPFKQINVRLAVRDPPPPRVTRKSEGEEEAWLPSTEELMGCKNADEFRDVVESARVPCSQLWKCTPKPA